MGLSEKKWIWKDGYQYRSTPLLEISSIDFSRNVFGPKTGLTHGSQQPFRFLDFFYDIKCWTKCHGLFV